MSVSSDNKPVSPNFEPASGNDYITTVSHFSSWKNTSFFGRERRVINIIKNAKTNDISLRLAIYSQTSLERILAPLKELIRIISFGRYHPKELTAEVKDLPLVKHITDLNAQKKEIQNIIHHVFEGYKEQNSFEAEVDNDFVLLDFTGSSPRKKPEEVVEAVSSPIITEPKVDIETSTTISQPVFDFELAIAKLRAHMEKPGSFSSIPAYDKWIRELFMLCDPEKWKADKFNKDIVNGFYEIPSKDLTILLGYAHTLAKRQGNSVFAEELATWYRRSLGKNEDLNSLTEAIKLRGDEPLTFTSVRNVEYFQERLVKKGASIVGKTLPLSLRIFGAMATAAVVFSILSFRARSLNFTSTEVVVANQPNSSSLEVPVKATLILNSTATTVNETFTKKISEVIVPPLVLTENIQQNGSQNTQVPLITSMPASPNDNSFESDSRLGNTLPQPSHHSSTVTGLLFAALSVFGIKLWTYRQGKTQTVATLTAQPAVTLLVPPMVMLPRSTAPNKIPQLSTATESSSIHQAKNVQSRREREFKLAKDAFDEVEKIKKFISPEHYLDRLIQFRKKLVEFYGASHSEVSKFDREKTEIETPKSNSNATSQGVEQLKKPITPFEAYLEQRESLVQLLGSSNPNVLQFDNNTYDRVLKLLEKRNVDIVFLKGLFESGMAKGSLDAIDGLINSLGISLEEFKFINFLWDKIQRQKF